MTKNIMIVGVGGQGTLLASRLLGNVITSCGYDLKVSEVHGMSQRGGSVVTYVRYGEEVFSPIVDKGEADYIIAFEQLEAYRYISYLKKGGTIITNSAQIEPMPVITGMAEYPTDILNKIKAKGINLLCLDALTAANQAGSAKAVNVVLMGVISCLMDFDEEKWNTAITECVPPKFLEVNQKAFELGRKLYNTERFSQD